MDELDSFAEAAFIGIGLRCDSCHAVRDDENPSPLDPRYPETGWDRAIADVA